MTNRITEQLHIDQLPQALAGGMNAQRARTETQETLARESAKQKREALERAFEVILRHTLKGTGIEFCSQYQLEGAGYKYDFCIPSHKILIEVNGGQWQAKGGHNSGRGVARDAKKANHAMASGWRLLTFVTDDLKKPLEISIMLLKVLKGKFRSVASF